MKKYEQKIKAKVIFHTFVEQFIFTFEYFIYDKFQYSLSHLGTYHTKTLGFHPGVCTIHTLVASGRYGMTHISSHNVDGTTSRVLSCTMYHVPSYIGHHL